MNDLHILKFTQLLFKISCITKIKKHSFLTPYAYLIQNYFPRTITPTPLYKKDNSQALTTACQVYIS